MRNVWPLAGFVLLAVVLCAAPSKSLYSWYGYENAVYQDVKKGTPESQEKLLGEYERIIARQEAIRRTVPPGMYAEYGFLLCRSGHREEGISYLKEEIRLYPESEKYISRIIKQLEEK